MTFKLINKEPREVKQNSFSFSSYIVGPLFRVCFEHIENFFLINHLGHILFRKVRVFKVLPSVMKINSLFLYVSIVRPIALVLCF